MTVYAIVWCDLCCLWHLPRSASADYGTSEVFPQWAGFLCQCGAPDCRGQLKFDDWKSLAFQRKYAGHVLKHVAAKIAQHHTKVVRAPCVPACLPCFPFCFSPLLVCVSSFTRLQDVYGLEVLTADDGTGRYLVTTVGVPADQCVMILAPNCIQPIADIPNADLCLQVLHPAALTCSCELANCIHSCLPVAVMCRWALISTPSVWVPLIWITSSLTHANPIFVVSFGLTSASSCSHARRSHRARHSQLTTKNSKRI